jgi:flagellar biosynthesis GTPase FlhF
MKKTRIYIIAPVLALAVFIGYYWNFNSTYEEKQAHAAAEAKERKIEAQRRDAEQREQAIAVAVEAQKQRKLEREAREATDRKQRDDKENAQLNADKAEQESEKLERQADKLTKDVEAAKKEVADIEAESQESIAEEAHLKELVSLAEANRAKLGDVLTKIQAADDALARAAALAAAAAKKNE